MWHSKHQFRLISIIRLTTLLAAICATARVLGMPAVFSWLAIIYIAYGLRVTDQR